MNPPGYKTADRYLELQLFHAVCPSEYDRPVGECIRNQCRCRQTGKNKSSFPWLSYYPELGPSYQLSQTLETVVQELDRTLFEGYIRPKATAVLAVVRNGVLDPQMDWYETPRPTGTLLFVY